MVPAGSYRVMALRMGAALAAADAPPVDPASVSEAPGAWATQTIAVGDQNVDGVTLLLRPGLRISGRVEFQGASERPGLDPNRPGSAVTAAPAVPLLRAAPRPPRATVKPSGEFAILGVPPGRYVLRMPDAPRWTLRSVTAGGRDVTDALVTVREADLADVVITFTDQPATLSGSVRMTGGATDPDASVFIFPADRARWPDARSSLRSFRAARVLKTGAFTLASVLPGEYLIAAVADAATGEWPDERLIAKLAVLAKPIRIDPGQKQAVTLTTVDLR
jgi:hypothetical protein